MERGGETSMGEGIGKGRENEQGEGNKVKRAGRRGLEQVRGAGWRKGGRRQQGAWRDRQAGTKVYIAMVQTWCADSAVLGRMLRDGV